MDQKTIIYLLGTALESGEDTKRKALTRQNVHYHHYQSATKELVNAVDESLLLSDPEFTFSLRLAIARNMADFENWQVFFYNDLKSMFPLSTAQKLYQKALLRLRIDLENDKDILPSDEKIKEFFDKRKPILDKFFNENCSKGESAYHWFPREGTATFLEKCPQCGESKRCDAKTKTFRCKCGFEKQYPLTESQKGGN